MSAQVILAIAVWAVLLAAGYIAIFKRDAELAVGILTAFAISVVVVGWRWYQYTQDSVRPLIVAAEQLIEDRRYIENYQASLMLHCLRSGGEPASNHELDPSIDPELPTLFVRCDSREDTP